MQGGIFLDQIQTDTTAVIQFGITFVHSLIKAIKYLPEIFRIYATTGITHTDQSIFSSVHTLLVYLYHDITVIRSEFKCIGKRITDDLVHFIGIKIHIQMTLSYLKVKIDMTGSSHLFETAI